MKIIRGSKQSGKTTKLIKMSAKTGGYIICHNRSEVMRIGLEANRMGLNIPFPLTFDEVLNKQIYGKGIRSVLIDNADIFLQRACGDINIMAITLTKGEK